ncbi:MAG: flagellar hook-associated 2 domain protein [Candidatus Solibacter sp.]|nr:flagellar hook-associated 2 domain protein [Candidatus Solibacter sp.]
MSTGSIFTGSSQFSTDFQNVVSRAVQIASLPMAQMSSNKAELSNQSNALSGLDSVFKALQSSIKAIDSSLGKGSLQASVSDSTKATAVLGTGALEGIYSVKIVDPGTFATSTTVAEDYTGTHAFKLSLNGVAYGLTVADNTAAGVASAINTQYGDQVQATVVNVGSGTTPDYRISLRASKLGNVDPQVLDGTTSLSDNASKITGVPASYVVNQSNVTSTSDSRSLSIADGVTVNLLPGATGTVDITVAPASSTMTTALSNFASAYNAAVDAIGAQSGQSGGALAGDPILGQLTATLRQLGTYSDPSSSVSALATLGFDLGADGHMTFNQFAFAALNSSSATGVASFLGSATGTGFLRSATDALNTAEQTDSGILPTAQASRQSGIANLTTQIASQQDRVDTIQTQLQQQMSAADSLIASMEQKYSYIANMFSAMNTANQQYK